MVPDLLKHSQRYLITLRLSLLSIFILLFLLMMMSLLSLFYFHLTRVVDRAALLLMDKATYAALEKLDDAIQLNPADPLKQMATFIKTQTIGETGQVFILNEQGKRLAPLASTSIPVERAFALVRKSHQSMLQFNDHGRTYFAGVHSFTLPNKQIYYIVAIAPESEFTKQIHSIEALYLILIVLIFGIGLIVMSHLVTRVLNPIKELVAETEKIKNFNLEGKVEVQSRIKEVIELSNAIESMKGGLRSFKKYVPADLVRQLIKNGEDAISNSSKRNLTVFFSDIKDFTAITERSEPHRLVQQLCDYFETLTQIITVRQGTLDKYIGDAVMAFWGAPVAVQYASLQSANAALASVRALTKLNQLWRDADLNAFHTRIGIHSGEAIVGSLGSSERLNYTALGDTVNIASRLVDVNKMYGTTILVSDSVYQEIHTAYRLRFIDSVFLKGKVERITLYELLGEKEEKLPFDVTLYEKIFTQAYAAYKQQLWQEAITLFNECLQIYPKDSVAMVLIERCVWLSLNPPPVDWDGIWQIS
ncbi:MAG: hypothetical protein H0W64_07890 [Gammaproteobacteria bacterium]|nr:hypothetical protein [Gammaproteobacteria bacterium]